MKPILTLLFAGLFCSCEIDRHNVILAVAAKDYRAKMKWVDIREAEFNEPYTMHVMDTTGHPIPLFRYMHDSRQLMPLDEDPIHISTPIIVDKKYSTFILAISDHTKERKRVRVDVDALNVVPDGPAARVLPIDLR